MNSVEVQCIASPSSRPKPLHLNSRDSVVQNLIFGWKQTPTWQRTNIRVISEVLWERDPLYSTHGAAWQISYGLGWGPGRATLHALLSCVASWPVLGKLIQAAVL